MSPYFFSQFSGLGFLQLLMAKKKPPGAEEGGKTRHPEAWR